MKNKQVDLGAVRLTAAVTDEMLENPDFASHVLDSLRRYRECDWGPISNKDKARNEEAMADPFDYGEISAFYEYPGLPEWEICIMTESGGRRPNQTTVTLPDDYDEE